MTYASCLPGEDIYADFLGHYIITNHFAEIEMDTNFKVVMKFEGNNPAGSIKLKTAISLIQNLERTGALKAGGRVIESSSGNLGIALAMICANKGYDFTCVVDPNAPRESLKTIMALGGNIALVSERDENGGFLGTRIKYIQDALRHDPGLVWPNQYENAANIDAHARTTAAEILRAYPLVDYFVVGAGTTGTLMGCIQQVRASDHPAKVIAVDVVGSVTFGGVSGPRKIPGLGTSRKPPICDPGRIDDVILVTEEETIRQCRWFAQKYGLLLGGSSGSVLAGIASLRDRIPANSLIVTISPDRGDRYVNTIYDDEWVLNFFPDALSTGEHKDSSTVLNEAVA